MGNKMICFDMDGTIADLYNVPNWLERLRNEDAGPYLEARPKVDMDRLRKIVLDLRNQGWEIRIISWLSKDSTPDFKKVVRKAKLEWLTMYQFPYEATHLVQYGTRKDSCVRNITNAAILIDDNENVRDGWRLGDTIDPTEDNWLDKLESLVLRIVE